MKKLLISDTHLGIHKSSDIWHQSAIKLFKSIIDNCNRKNIKTIIHLGDWFDDRKTLNIKTLSVTIHIMEMLKNFNVIIIIGNHDSYYKTDVYPTSLDVFKEYKNVSVIRETCTIDNITLVPWEKLTPEILKKGGKFLFGHFEINSFYTNEKHIYNKSIFNINDFKNFDLVLSGHFHIPTKKNNIIYLGSPYHMSFNDVNSDRGYYIFDDNNIEFISFTDAPQYVIINSEQEIKSDIITNNIVKLQFLKDYGINENTKIIESIRIHNPLQLYTDFSSISIIEDKVTDFDEIENIKIMDHKDIFFEYINKIEIPEHLKKSVMKQMINKILKE